MLAGQRLGTVLRRRAGDQDGCRQHRKVIHRASGVQRGGTSLPGRLQRRVCHVCQLVPGPGSLPGDLVSGNRRNLGAGVPLSARHLQLSPAVSLLTIPIPLLGALPWEQRDPGASDVPRVLCSAEGAGAVQLGWKGLGGAGRTTSPPQKLGAKSSVSGMLRVKRSCRLHPEPPAARAVFSVQRYEFLVCTGHRIHLRPCPTRSSVTPC